MKLFRKRFKKTGFAKDLDRLKRYAKCGNEHMVYRVLMTKPELCATVFHPKSHLFFNKNFMRICDERNIALRELACNRIMCAAAANDVDFIESLIVMGLDLSIENEDGETIFGFACAWDAVEVVKLLCDNGVDVNQPENGATVLVAVEHTAKTNKKQEKIRQILVAHGAVSIDTRNND